MTVSGKIIRKVVKPGQKGATISFLVQTSAGEKWVSVFESRITPEAKNVLQALVEGLYADFECVENIGKTDGKVYLNIVSAIPVTQVREDVVAPPSGPSVRVDTPGTPREGDTKIRSMALSYAKDLAISMPEKMDIVGADGLIDWGPIIGLAKKFEQYILTGD